MSLNNTADACKQYSSTLLKLNLLYQINVCMYMYVTLAVCSKRVSHLSRITWRSLTLFPMMISHPSSAYQQTSSVPRRESSAHKYVSRTTNDFASYCAFGAVCNILNTKERVSPRFQTPRRELKIRHIADHF